METKNGIKNEADAERVSASICKRCNKEFEPYPESDDCHSCKDGDYETDMDRYDGGTDIISCPFCRGTGSHDWIEKNHCKDCREIMNYFEDDY